ncbi:hypothetical protein OESDEN_18388 [Oesophagostomum dentatum]|uniref:Uncharacterized protein n=1 Tax=Oesophagostomum dentatum TaxID=61180 RepID=A0A0B1S9E5_OESDE|nr:hypothetical protein OESDEN_18388 [Oesophagostomum dentatum]
MLLPRFVLGEQSCARLSSRVVEPLLRWKRVFVSRRGGQIIPLGTDFEPIDGHVINSQPHPTGPSLDSFSESQEDSGSSTFGTVKRRLKADPEIAGAVADRSGQKSATKRPGSIMSSNDEETTTVVKKRCEFFQHSI